MEKQTYVLNVIIPMLDNDGHSTARATTWFCEQVLAAAGGYTQSEVSGCWRNECGQFFADRSFQFTVSDLSRGKLFLLLGLLPELAARTHQQAIYCDYAPRYVRFVAPCATPTGATTDEPIHQVTP